MESDSDEILLINQKDLISIRSHDLEEIINEISNAFAFYNRWEMKLLLDAREDDPEQKIIDDYADVFGPIFMMDMEMRRVALSSKYGIGMVNKIWDDMILTGGMSSLNILEDIRESWFFNNYLKVQKCSESEYEITGVEEVRPYNYGIIISQVNDKRDPIAQMIISSKEKSQKVKFNWLRSSWRLCR